MRLEVSDKGYTTYIAGGLEQTVQRRAASFFLTPSLTPDIPLLFLSSSLGWPGVCRTFEGRKEFSAGAPWLCNKQKWLGDSKELVTPIPVGIPHS